MRSSAVSIAWYCYDPTNNYFVTSTKQETSQLQVWTIKNSTPYKLGMVELGSAVVKDRDVSFMTLYGFTFMRVNINQGEGDSSVLTEIKLYSVLPDQV